MPSEVAAEVGLVVKARLDRHRRCGLAIEEAAPGGVDATADDIGVR
jgi:hypothetical protein